MKYRDEIHIAMMALVFSCAMFAIYAVVPKDAIVAAKARATVKHQRQQQKLRRSVPHRKKMPDFRFILRTVTMIMTILRMIPIIQTQVQILPIQLLPTRTIPLSIHPLTTIMMTVPVIM